MYLVALYMMVQPLSLFSAYAGGLHRLSAPIYSSGLGVQWVLSIVCL